mmetsp:Transcript_49355/g.97250  ORF Transcript_49355/g.97250 Transcript_49355/m.97250 type:complete len:211 (-) Transcript_49355:1742-2374(-)
MTAHIWLHTYWYAALKNKQTASIYPLDTGRPPPPLAPVGPPNRASKKSSFGPSSSTTEAPTPSRANLKAFSRRCSDVDSCSISSGLSPLSPSFSCRGVSGTIDDGVSVIFADDFPLLFALPCTFSFAALTRSRGFSESRDHFPYRLLNRSSSFGQMSSGVSGRYLTEAAAATSSRTLFMMYRPLNWASTFCWNIPEPSAWVLSIPSPSKT